MMLTDIQLTPEFILSFFGVVFMAGAFYSIQKRLEVRMKETEHDLHDVIKQQAVHDEKINKIDEKLNKMEIQNTEIIKILTKGKLHDK